MIKDMLSTEIHHPHINALAERLVADIRRRGLGVGDRYMTVEAVSQMLGVRRAVAGKAIRQLAEQEILIPKQRTGTFVGPGLKRQNRSKVRTVFVLLPAGDPSASHWSYKPFVNGIRGEIPDANVQFTFVPETDPAEYVRELIDGARTLGQFVGVVAVSCPGEVYSFLADERVPAVVFGSLCSVDMPLTSVDADNALCGRLLIEYLVRAGHHRIALMMSSAGRPGDNDFLDGICDALTTAGLPANALIHRLSRSQLDGVRAMSKELLERSDRPTAIITRGIYPAEAVDLTARGLGLRVPDDLEIVFTHADETASRLNAESYPRVEPTISFTDIARMIGRILKEMSDGTSPQPNRVLIPVELRLPERNATG
jgi:DNA-binding LacI/PurR family transcriptional regulator